MNTIPSNNPDGSSTDVNKATTDEKDTAGIDRYSNQSHSLNVYSTIESGRTGC